MEVTDAETQPRGRLESPTGGVHADGGRGKGVFGGKHQGAPVLSILIGSARGPGEDVVPPARQRSVKVDDGKLGYGKHPLKNIRLRGMGHNKRRRVLLDVLIFASELQNHQLVLAQIGVAWRVVTDPFKSRFCRHLRGYVATRERVDEEKKTGGCAQTVTEESV